MTNPPPRGENRLKAALLAGMKECQDAAFDIEQKLDSDDVPADEIESHQNALHRIRTFAQTLNDLADTRHDRLSPHEREAVEAGIEVIEIRQGMYYFRAMNDEADDSLREFCQEMSERYDEYVDVLNDYLDG